MNTVMDTTATETTETIAVGSIDEIVEAVKNHDVLLPIGNGTKPALSPTRNAVTRLDLRTLTGILEYAPAEYTFTARAGTPLLAVQNTLAEHGQYLPFDPPLANAGATLGGTVAAGLSGSGRYRYGGLRDFLLGVRLVDGLGRVTMGGGKVVKNAAGFDLPKLLVGSLGQLGIMAELTFKVFPAPKAYATLKVPAAALTDALNTVQRLSLTPYEMEALDINTHKNDYQIWLRLGGLPAALPARIERIQNLVEGGEIIPASREAEYWGEHGEFRWSPPGSILAKIPITPAQVPTLDAELMAQGAERRYSVAANVAWLAYPGDIATLDSLLKNHGLSALILRGKPDGEPSGPILGSYVPSVFAERVKHALDPHNKFLSLRMDSE